MTRADIEKKIAEYEDLIRDSKLAIAALSEQLDKTPKRETLWKERWLNHYAIGNPGVSAQEVEADAISGPYRLGPAERIVREFDLVDGRCVEQRCGLTGRVIWRENGGERVEKPENLHAKNGACAAWCSESKMNGRVIFVNGVVLDSIAPVIYGPWFIRAVAWVNDGEAAR